MKIDSQAHTAQGLPRSSAAGDSDSEVPREASSGSSLRNFGDYELLEEIARGGMGVVYRARQRSLNRIVALKMILTGQWASEVEVQRFRHEAAAAARLSHPHIVPIYEFSERDGLHYFSMKLVEGGSLADQIEAFITEPRKAVALMIAVARAVHHAHQRGILHRDLKPANILLDSAGAPHITDFGLAKPLDMDGSDGPTRSGAIVGTIAYMAPEQAEGHNHSLTTTADVYSLGAILYELLTGRPPFRGVTPLATLRDVLERDPLSPRAYSRLVDRDLATICLKCLHKSPPRRYSSADALADDLARWLAHEPVQARPASALEHVTKWARRRKAAAALVGVSLVAGVALLVVDFRYRRDLAGALQRQRRLGYAASLNLAEQALRQGRVERALQLLERQRPLAGFADQRDLRGFEWYYLRAACLRDYVLRGHEGPVRAVAFSTDGATLATGSGDGQVRLFDVRSGALQQTLRAHVGPVRAVLFGQDGALVSGGLDGAVRRWDARTGAARGAVFERGDSVHALALSPDGATLALGSDVSDHPRLLALGAQVGAGAAATRSRPGQRGGVLAVSYAPDGRTLASGNSEGRVLVLDARGGQVTRELPAHGEAVFALAFTVEGTLLTSNYAPAQVVAGPLAPGVVPRVGGGIAALAAERAIVEWDLETLQPRRRYTGLPSRVFSLALSPDGQHLAAGGEDGSVRLFSRIAKAPPRDHDHGGAVVEGSAAVEPSAVVAGSVSVEGTVAVAGSVTGGRRLRGHPAAVWALAFSPDGRTLVSGSGDSSVRLWDVHSGEPLPAPRVRPLPAAAVVLAGHQGWVTAAAFSPDGRQLLTGSADGAPRLWDAARGEPLGLLPAFSHGGAVHAAAFSPDGHYLATAGADHSAALWERRAGRLALRGVLREHGGDVREVAFSPAGNLLATASEDGLVRLWALPLPGSDAPLALSPLRELAGHTHPAYAVAFAPDGRTLASGSHDGELRLWRAPEWRAQASLVGHSGGVIALAFSATLGRLTLVSGSFDWDGKLWDVSLPPPQLRQRAVLRGHDDRIFALAVAPEGEAVMTTGQDGTVRVWDLDTGQERVALSTGIGAARSLAVSPDGTALVLGGKDQAVLWRAPREE